MTGPGALAGESGVVRPLRLLALLALLATAAVPAVARNSAPDLDQLLRWQDEMVLRQFLTSYPQDYRYAEVLGRVSARLNPHLDAVYGDGASRDAVRYFVFVGRMGFNAQTWNRLIILDSMLMDSLRSLSRGLAVRGSVNDPFIQNLAVAVARTHAACRAGTHAPDFRNLQNPYNLPTMYGLRPADRDVADAMFEEMVASWIAHEASHAFLNHVRERAEAIQLAQLYASSRADEMRRHIQQSMTCEYGRQKELEADEYAVRLLLRAGYGVEGLVHTFEFAQMLEELTGESRMPLRTHPTPLERIRFVRQVAAQLPPR